MSLRNKHPGCPTFQRGIPDPGLIAKFSKIGDFRWWRWSDDHFAIRRQMLTLCSFDNTNGIEILTLMKLGFKSDWNLQNMCFTTSMTLCFWALIIGILVVITVTSYTIQDEGNACFDMVASMPGLQTFAGEHFILMNAHFILLWDIVTISFTHFSFTHIFV